MILKVKQNKDEKRKKKKTERRTGKVKEIGEDVGKEQ